MSDRNRTIQGTNTALETGASLDGLSASRDLHQPVRSQAQLEASNDSDLTSASISASDVMRVSQRPGGRRDVATRQSTETERTSLRASPRQPEKAPAQSKRQHGVITNPAYKYEGGLVSKLVSFFANILKVLERLLLRLLMGPDVVAPSIRSKNTTQAGLNQSESPGDEEKREREKRERIERGQPIARS